MARKRHQDKDILKLLRDIEVHIHGCLDEVSASRKVGVSDKTYYAWSKKFGGIGRSHLSKMNTLEKHYVLPSGPR